MAPFDPKAYETAVVKPLRTWTGRELPDDLLPRYAVDLAMSDAELARRLAEIRSHWNKGAQSTGKSAIIQNLYKAFLRADDELKKAHGTDIGKIEWWRQYQAARAGARKTEIDELANTLRKSFGELGLITSGQLDATMRATFAALAPDEVATALGKAGVAVRTPTELPRSTALPRTMYRALCAHLTEARVTTVPELLFGEITKFTIIDAFTCEPAHPDGLTGRAVSVATARENKRAENQAARQALGILDHATKSGVDLRELTLCHLMGNIRQHHSEGVPPHALLKQLRQTGLDDDDARQAVFSVLNESAAGQVDGLAAVKELLAEGQLGAAQQALATITGAEDATAAKDLVRRHAEQVKQLCDSAHQALRNGNEAAAVHDLRQAAALAVDDEDIAAELRRIPPPPVLAVSAQPEGVGVRVSWRADASHGEQTRYRVVRRDGRVPEDVDDGTTVGGGDTTLLLDAKAPAGRLVGYAVFAAVEGGVWSRPAGVAIEVLPPVHNVVLTVDRGTVAGRWQVHPDVLAVEVLRGTGKTAKPVRTSGKTVFQDRDAPEGDDHTYTLAARYRRDDGSEAMSARVIARTTSKGGAVPVSALILVAIPARQGTQVQVRWRQQPDAEVTVRRAAEKCPWQFGTVVPLASLNDYGEEVAGRHDVDGEWRTLTADVPLGHFWYLPFTLGKSGAVCGQEADLGIALPVTGVRHQRLGADVLLSWSWPELVGIAEVRWRTEDGKGRQRLTRQQYQDAGGCRIRCGTGQFDAEVCTVVHAEGGECLSAPVSMSVSGLPTAISYTVDMTRRPMVGGGVVRVRVTANQSVPNCTVLVVAAQGAVMPRQPTDGTVLLRSTVDIKGDDQVELTAELPRLRRPYWVRCFLDHSDGVLPPLRLVDPPTKQMKVS